MDDYPQWGKLENIYVVSNRVVFELILLETSTYLSHYNAYAVSTTSTCKLFTHFQLLSPIPQHIHQIIDSTVIVPKFHVCGSLL